MSWWGGLALLVPVVFVLQAPTAAWSSPLMRPGSPLLMLWLLLVWALPARLPWRVTGLAVTALLAAGLAVPALALAGVPTLEAGREVLATVLQAGVTLVFYHRFVRGGDLVPHHPRDLVLLALSSVAGGVAGALVAVDLTSEVSALVPALLAWVVLGTAHAFVGVACLLLLVKRPPRAESLPTRALDVTVLLLVAAAALVVDVALPQLPLSWLLLLAAVWAGLQLGPWAAAAYSLVVGTGAVVVEVLRVRAGDLAPEDLLAQHGLVAGFVGVTLVLSLTRDQRERLAQEVVRRRQEAVDQAELLQTLVESMSECLVLVDQRGIVQLHNRAALSLLGPDRLATEPAKWLARDPDLPTRFSYSMQRNVGDESPRVIAVQLAQVQYAGSEGVVAMARDTTHEQRRLEELTSFAAVAAHDLKSPLAAVQGWLEVAEESVYSDPGRAGHAMRRGRSAARRMTADIDDWLAYTVAREGELSPEPVPLAPLLHELATTHEAAELQLMADDVVHADRTLLRHLLSNLVGNAVKYTQPGQRPHVTVLSGPGAPGWVRLEVRDRGIGIPQDEETAVFEPFRRASGVDGAYEGSGLGLALCKRIVRRHGGAISAHANHDGPGTTMVLTLPAPRVPS